MQLLLQGRTQWSQRKCNFLYYSRWDSKLGSDQFGHKQSRESEYHIKRKQMEKCSWDDVFTDQSLIPRANVKQNPMNTSCHSRFRCFMLCRATSEVTSADSEFVICESCGCVGGDCDDLGTQKLGHRHNQLNTFWGLT